MTDKIVEVIVIKHGADVKEEASTYTGIPPVGACRIESSQFQNQ